MRALQRIAQKNALVSLATIDVVARCDHHVLFDMHCFGYVRVVTFNNSCNDAVFPVNFNRFCSCAELCTTSRLGLACVCDLQSKLSDVSHWLLSLRDLHFDEAAL